jgi:tetraacyldisaccharide 4'-kinase
MLIYCFVIFLKKQNSTKYIPPLPVVSIGNLTIGGSGKTPLTITLTKHYLKSAVILRGYGRKSKGLFVVKDWDNILCDYDTAGDEALVYAKLLKNSLVIVSEDRIKAIKKAKELGAKIVFLDDGFSKKNIHKFDILIKPNPLPANNYCLPSGCYREPIGEYKNADFIIDEKKDIKRVVTLNNPTKNMILITAIAKPQRLDEFLPKLDAKYTFKDHYDFKEDEVLKLVKKHNATSIVCTLKDSVKLDRFLVELSILDLEIELKVDLISKIDRWVDAYL